MIGTRGVPAQYGGFETAVEEIGWRLAERGHEIVVYCRAKHKGSHYRGMELVRRPALRVKTAETATHTFASVVHPSVAALDVALVFNAANAFALPLLRRQGVATALHVDGLEWKRGKWGPLGRRWYLASERLGVRWADELIADSKGIAEYYRDRYGASTTYIAYGAPIVDEPRSELLADRHLQPRGYHLVVARLEPENNVGVIVEAYRASRARLPLVIVGDAPYAQKYIAGIHRAAAADSRIRFLGAVWDQHLLDALYANSRAYIHGHSVGGTNPSLLRAMGAGAPVIAFDVNFNREVIGDTGMFFSGRDLGHVLEEFELSDEAHVLGEAARERVRRLFSWDDVTHSYEALCEKLAGKDKARVREAA